MTTIQNLPVLHKSPEYCRGAYDMHFYCKYKNKEHPYCNRYGDLYMKKADSVQTRGEAIAQMRGEGWIFHRDWTATCPICRSALKQCATNQVAEEEE